MDPDSLDLQLARFSGLTSLNLLRWSSFGHIEEEIKKDLYRIRGQSIVLRPEELEKLVCLSGSLQKLWVAFKEDPEVIFAFSVELD